MTRRFRSDTVQPQRTQRTQRTHRKTRFDCFLLCRSLFGSWCVIDRMRSETPRQPLVEQVAALAMKLAGRHLADYGATTSRHDFTQRQLMVCLILRAYLKATYRGVLDLLATSPGLRRELGLEEQIAALHDAAKVQRPQQGVGDSRCHGAHHRPTGGRGDLWRGCCGHGCDRIGNDHGQRSFSMPAGRATAQVGENLDHRLVRQSAAVGLGAGLGRGERHQTGGSSGRWPAERFLAQWHE